MGKFDGILICTDLDGTLYKNDKTISKENKNAIEYFKREGGYFTFITGRLPYYSMDAFNSACPNVPFGCINGGGLYDGEKKSYVSMTEIPREVLELVRHIDERFPDVGIQICCFDKTYFAKDALPEIKQERENARRAFVLGINTAIPYGIVRVGDGYGTVTELLNATSVTKLIRNNPDDLSEAAKYYIDMLKSIHAIEVEDGEVPDMRETALEWADFVSTNLPKEQGDKLRALIEAIPKQNTLVHGDYHTNNIMVQNGEPLLIDMDTLCMGHPVFELGSMYNAFLGFSEIDYDDVMRFMGYTRETSERFWNLALKMYLGTDDEAVCQSVAEKAMIIGYTRMLRRALRRPNEAESPARIARYSERLITLLNKYDTLTF